MFSAINHIMKQMIMHMRQETVEEYLKRGGTITKIPQTLDTVGGWWGSVLRQPEPQLITQLITQLTAGSSQSIFQWTLK